MRGCRGERTKQPFPCIRYFFIRPVVRLSREKRSRDFSGATFRREGTRKTKGRVEEPSATEVPDGGGRTYRGGTSSARPHEPNREG